MIDHARIVPRFMTDGELRAWFGLSERALNRLRATRSFPPKDEQIGKTDRRSVEVFFDRRAGLDSPLLAGGNPAAVDGREYFDD
jgi:hypothetical protein